ncbi:MAG: hypothetical protein K2H85_11165, partial [Allobaculum sp.]|nr:hypothetical protein [Allobaculum sp.]
MALYADNQRFAFFVQNSKYQNICIKGSYADILVQYLLKYTTKKILIFNENSIKNDDTLVIDVDDKTDSISILLNKDKNENYVSLTEICDLIELEMFLNFYNHNNACKVYFFEYLDERNLNLTQAQKLRINRRQNYKEYFKEED